MNKPQVNVDYFYHRPVHHVVGLLGYESQIPALTEELQTAGVDVASVKILCGKRGAAILDEHGEHHGLRGRLIRAFQRVGYDETILSNYAEGVEKGELLLYVPTPPPQRYRIASLLQRHQAHHVGYFGPGTFEQFPVREQT